MQTPKAGRGPECYEVTNGPYYVQEMCQSWYYQGFIQDFELGGGKTGRQQDDSNVQSVCVPTRGVWGHAPQENFEFISSQIASDSIWDKIPKQHFDDTYLRSVTLNS